MLPLKEIEKMTEERTKNIRSVSHSFDHLKRTAVGARWFSDLFGGLQEDQDIAYIAGLVHDFGRPLSEIEHKDISLGKAKKFLEKFNIERKIKARILKMVEEHRYQPDAPLLEQCLFLSDKVLEQSGAFIIFRRCVYVGECIDFRDMPFQEAILFHWDQRMKRFHPKKFHKAVSRIIIYQYEWQTRFIKAFKNNEDWSVYTARACYDAGKAQKSTLEKIIKEINAGREGKEFKDEAMSYIKGKKFQQFKEMIQ